MLAVGDTVRWSTWPEDTTFLISELLPNNEMMGSLFEQYSVTQVRMYSANLIQPNRYGHWIKVYPAKSNLLQRKGIKYVSN